MVMGHSIEKQLDTNEEQDNVIERVLNAIKVWQAGRMCVMTREELRTYTESVWKQGYDAAMAEMGVDQDE